MRQFVRGVRYRWGTFWYRLGCKHEELYVEREGDWIPTFAKTNGLDDEDTCEVEYRCMDCAKSFMKVERRNGYFTSMNLSIERNEAVLGKDRRDWDGFKKTF